MTPMTDTLSNKVILVTGAGNGIGAAVALAYAQQAATVVLLDKDVAALERTYDSLISHTGITPAIYPVDLKGATVDDYQQLVATIDQHFGQLDGLVHCAASLGQIAPVQLQSPSIWLETLHINLTAPYLLTRACLGLLAKQERASILFTTDHHKNKAYWSALGVSKGAIETLCSQLADELESDGKVNVNCIEPGLVNTALYRQAFPASDPSTLPDAADIVGPYLEQMLPKPAQETIN